MSVKCELYNDNFQNWKSYNIQKAQLGIFHITSGQTLLAALRCGGRTETGAMVRARRLGKRSSIRISNSTLRNISTFVTGC